jgi:drug/metabolite transporter (DMT)-like permease
MPDGLTVPGATIAVGESTGAGRRQVRGFLWAGLSVMIFSGWFVITRYSVTRQLQIWDILALRFGVGTLVLAPTILRRGSRLPAATWREGLLFCLLWGLPFVLLVALGPRLTSAAEAAAIAPAAMPVFAGILCWVFLRERQGKARWAGYNVIVLGLVCLVEMGAPTGGPPNAFGLAALVGAALLWAIYTIVFRRSGLSAVQAAALICTWSAILFLPAYAVLGLSRLPLASSSELAFEAVYQGVFMSRVAVVAFNRAVALLGPSAATAIIALLPAVASILAIPVLGEMPLPIQWVAILMIGIGVCLAAKRPPVRSFSPKHLSWRE